MVNKKEIEVMQLDWFNQVLWFFFSWVILTAFKIGELFFALVSGISDEYNLPSYVRFIYRKESTQNYELILLKKEI